MSKSVQHLQKITTDDEWETDPEEAWNANTYDGFIYHFSKFTPDGYVWPVRKY